MGIAMGDATCIDSVGIHADELTYLLGGSEGGGG
eukprot:CAMPEP_0181130980 /NCGR_PEP_ID=MMETSP1071-20121207/30163_1 /TAXON_ID=35127 /ORGANISM="Thalassiosira sp., Strain NH16" /LENGTH=33 /DNA_ID= /DNA_START= /DNA_END= /DNA_ORIENTATION=